MIKMIKILKEIANIKSINIRIRLRYILYRYYANFNLLTLFFNNAIYFVSLHEFF